MKTIFIALSCMMLTTTLAFSNPDKLSISEQINKQVAGFKTNIKEPYLGKARVTFKINNQGDVEVISIQTDDEIIREHLQKTFGKINIKNINNLNQETVYEIGISIKVL